jgi:hypothetical protein
MLLAAMGSGLAAAEPGPTTEPSSAASASDTVAPSAPTTEPTTEPPSASSSEPADPKTRALALLHEGNALVAEADFASALEKFQAAYALYPSAKPLINIGTSLRYLGRNADAARSYERYLAHPDADPKRRAELERILDEISLVTGLLRIEVDPPDTTVRVDGHTVAGRASARTFRVDPGEHTVVGERPGFAPTVRTVKVERGTEQPVPLLLARPGAAAPIVVEPGSPDATSTAGYVVGAVGLAGLALGAVVGGLALSNDAAADEHCMATAPNVCDRDGVELGDTAYTQGIVSVVGLAAGGALSALGLVLVLAAPDSSSARPEAALTLRVGPRIEAALRF